MVSLITGHHCGQGGVVSLLTAGHDFGQDWMVSMVNAGHCGQGGVVSLLTAGHHCGQDWMVTLITAEHDFGQGRMVRNVECVGHVSRGNCRRRHQQVLLYVLCSIVSRTGRMGRVSFQ